MLAPVAAPGTRHLGGRHVGQDVNMAQTETGSPLPVLTIDGARFSDLDGFYDEVSEPIIPGAEWGRNLDAFNDILRGGFGTPEGGFRLRWANSDLSRDRLGWDETIRFVERKLTICHPQNVPHVQADLAAAHRHEGETLFELIVDIIRGHGEGGSEAEDNVSLILE
jgi:RNAse (barnase) inhibitor barstar